MGPVRERSKAHTCVSQGLTHVPRPRKEDARTIQYRTETESKKFEEKRLTSPSTEDPEEQKHLESTISGSLHRKVKF